MGRQAQSLVGLANKLQQTADYPTATAAALSETCAAVAQLVGDHLSSAPDDQLLHANVVLCEIGEHLRFVERSKVADTPWSMVEATERFLKGVVGDECRFIIRPQWSYNYNLDGEFIQYYSSLISSLRWIPETSKEKIFKERTKNKIYSISFPRSERLNPLLHANWGHEIGHITASLWLDNNFNDFWLSHQEEVRASIRKDLDGGEPTTDLFRKLDIDAAVAKRAVAAMDIARKGLRELLADAIGVHLLGPAAVAASANIAARGSLDISPLDAQSYPPWRYRLRLMLDACQGEIAALRSDSQIQSTFGPFLSWFDQLVNVTSSDSDRKVLRSDSRTRIPYAAIEKKFSEFRETVLKSVGKTRSERYSISSRKHVVEELSRRLERQLPPNEWGTWPNVSVAEYEDILNAGWIHKFGLVQRNDDNVDDALDTAHKLVLKAIESAQVHAVFGPMLAAL